MNYPILDIASAIDIADRLRAVTAGAKKQSVGLHDRDFLGLDQRIAYSEGATVEEDHLYSESERIRSELLDDGVVDAYIAGGSKSPRTSDVGEYLEEFMAERLHRLLDGLPANALHDVRFWRYLGLFPFRWFLLVREPELQPQDFGGSNAGRDKWLMVRTYQWGRKCHRDGATEPYSGVYAVRDTRRKAGASEGYVIDFYHSHIVRPRWADTPNVALAFVDATAATPPLIDTSTSPTEPVRSFARRVSRLSGNLCLPFLHPDEIGSVLMRERS